jgi:hypothetical protein
VKIILTTALGMAACGFVALSADILSNLPSPEVGVALGYLAASSLFTTGLMLLATALKINSGEMLNVRWRRPPDHSPEISRKSSHLHPLTDKRSAQRPQIYFSPYLMVGMQNSGFCLHAMP